MQYIMGLQKGSIFINDCEDVLKWSFNVNTRMLTTSLAYPQKFEETIFYSTLVEFISMVLENSFKNQNLPMLGF